MGEARVGLIYDDRYLQHSTGLQLLRGSGRNLPFTEPTIHPSNYRLIMRTKHLIDFTGLGKELVRLDPYPATDADLALYHSPDYLARVRAICAAGGGDTGVGAPAGEDSYEIGALAAGGGMAGVDAVMGGAVRRVFANIRPPGHHAMRDLGVGFCIFGNVVIAARHAQKRHGVRRVLILDWDVHAGNGTQDAFYADDDVLFISLHQDGFYLQGLGRLEQTGAGAGAGYTVNLPLPPGSGDAAYLAAFERIVLPIAHAFAPELVLVSAGQDASLNDSLGRMCVSTEGYRRMTEAVIAVAEAHADGRLVILQEGGYSELYGPYCTLAIVETLAGRRTGIEEPTTMEYIRTQPHHTIVGPSAEAALAAIRARHAPFWPCLMAEPSAV